MKQKLLLTLVAVLAMVLVPTGTASAWTFRIGNTGDCQPDGSFRIVWTVKNKTENQTLTITESNRAAVPVGSTVPANENRDFEETLNNTQAGKLTLILKGNWPGELTEQTHQSTVKLKVCEQPPTITVTKSTVPDGDQTSFSITITTEDGQVFGDAIQSIKDGESVVFKVAPGTYNVTEATMEGWTMTSNTCQDLTVGDENTNGIVVLEENNHENGNKNAECKIVNVKDEAPPVVLGEEEEQVEAPTGGVGAGLGGGSSTTSAGAALGLMASLGAAGYGLRRLAKFEL